MIRKELARLDALQTQRVDLDGDDLLAYRFMLVAPTPVIIKDENARVVWANLCYRRLVDSPLEDLRGKSVRDLSVLSWEGEAVERDILEALASESPSGTWSLEPVVIKKQEILFGTIRFVFRAGDHQHKFLGDVSFEWTHILPGTHRSDSDILERSRRAVIPKGAAALFAPFLRSCPTAIAIKDGHARIRFCNQIYADLAGRPIGTVVNRTAQEVFGLSGTDEHPLVFGRRALPTAHATRTREREPSSGGDARCGARGQGPVSVRVPPVRHGAAAHVPR